MPTIDPKKRQVRIDGLLFTYNELRILALLTETDGAVQNYEIENSTNISSGTVSEKTRALERKGLARPRRHARGVECADRARARAILTQVDLADFGKKIETAKRSRLRAKGNGVQADRLSFDAAELEVLLLLLGAGRPVSLRNIRLHAKEAGVKALAELESKGLVRVSWEGRLKLYECSDLKKVGSMLRRLGRLQNE